MKQYANVYSVVIFGLFIIIFYAGCLNDKTSRHDKIFDSIEDLSEKWLGIHCDSALFYAEQMKECALQSNNIKQKFRAARSIGKAYQAIGMHDSALIFFREMKDCACQLNDTGYILDAYSRLYLEFSSIQNYDSASYYSLNGKEISGIIKDTSMLAIFESSLGQIYFDLENKDSALKCFISAASHFESNNDTLNTAYSYRNIGNTLKKMGMNEDAIIYYKMALGLHRNINNIVESAVEMNNIAVVYKAFNPDSSRIYFLWSLALIDETGSIENKLMIRFNYANLLKSTENYTDALKIYEDVYEKSVKANILRGQIVSLNLIAKTYAALKQNAEAGVYFLKVIDLAKSKGMAEDLKRIYKEVFTFYLETGEINQAREYFGKWETLCDSLKDTYQIENVVKFKTLYETEKKERENIELKNNIEIKNRNNIIFISLGGILIMLLIFILYVFLQRTRYLKLLIARAHLQIEQYNTRKYETKLPADERRQESDLARDIHKILVEDTLCTNTQLTLDMLANELHVNRKILSATINHYFGMNFNSLVNFFRIEVAKKLLLDADFDCMKMEAIGHKSGFSTRQSFYIAFNKFVGVSPTEYRQNNISSQQKF